MSAQRLYSRYRPTRSSELNPIDFDTQNPCPFSNNWKHRDTSPTHFLCLSNQSQLPRDQWSSATAQERIYSCGKYSDNFVNCDLVNNKNIKVIKFETCIVNVVFQFYVIYYIVEVLIFGCNLSIKLKNHSLPNICLCELFPLLSCE
jgi:hypothetical protein